MCVWTLIFKVLTNHQQIVTYHIIIGYWTNQADTRMDYGVTKLKRSIRRGRELEFGLLSFVQSGGCRCICEVSDLLVVFRLLSTSVSMGFDITWLGHRNRIFKDPKLSTANDIFHRQTYIVSGSVLSNWQKLCFSAAENSQDLVFAVYKEGVSASSPYLV